MKNELTVKEQIQAMIIALAFPISVVGFICIAYVLAKGIADLIY